MTVLYAPCSLDSGSRQRRWDPWEVFAGGEKILRGWSQPRSLAHSRAFFFPLTLFHPQRALLLSLYSSPLFYSQHAPLLSLFSSHSPFSLARFLSSTHTLAPSVHTIVVSFGRMAKLFGMSEKKIREFEIGEKKIEFLK